MSFAPKIAVVCSASHHTIVERLQQGVKSVWLEHYTNTEKLDEFQVPTAFELPLMIKKLIRNYDAVIALGCEIRGETDYYEHICQVVSSGCMQLSLEYSKPVVFGVLAAPTRELALARAGGEKGNKGADALNTALRMLRVLSQLDN